MLTPDRIHWGILGTGNINRRFLPGARQASAVEIVAVASRDASRAAAFAKEHGIPHGLGSYEELLADPNVDAVYIATGTPSGVGVFRDPPRFLSAGDIVAVEIERIGRLENTCAFDGAGGPP
jgi:hypothetical protein